MKAIKIAVSLMLLMLLGTNVWAQTEVKEQLVVPLSEPGKPYRLEVNLLRGSITVNGYEGKDIVIDVRAENDKDRKIAANENAGGMKRLTIDNKVDIRATEKNNTIKVHSNALNQVIYHLTIKVPQRGATLKLRATNNGNVAVSNVSGEIEVSNINGGIQLNKISGSVVANTVNGNVVTVFKTVDPKSPMAFTTLNGNVDVTFPDNLKANIKLKSDRGDLYSDFDVVVDLDRLKVDQDKKQGMQRLHFGDWSTGKINGGGPEMLMKTMSGNIYVRKAK